MQIKQKCFGYSWGLLGYLSVLLLCLASSLALPSQALCAVAGAGNFDLNPAASEHISTPKAPVLIPKLLKTLWHNPNSYTQGLFFSKGYLYESSGRYGASSLFRLSAASGQILKQVSFFDYFVEGSVALDGKIHILTWQDQVRFILDENKLEQLHKIPLKGEGWGLCLAELPKTQALWYSDGSNILRCMRLSPSGAWEQIRQLEVIDPNTGQKVSNLNELELVNGYILANVWQSNQIAVIDPQSQALSATSETVYVKHWINCESLVPKKYEFSSDAVLNGIAWEAETQRLLVTGKLWDKIYELALPQELAKQ